MKRPFYTRKDLIILSLTLLYSILFGFVGLCLIDGDMAIMNKKNPIALFGNLFGIERTQTGITGYLFIVLVALYIAVFCGVLLYERRYAIATNKNPHGLKMFYTYAISLLACLLLSFGVSIVIILLTGGNVVAALLYVLQVFILTTLIYIILAILLGGIIMFVINFLLIDKPFKAFTNNEEIILFDETEHDPELDVQNSFDTKGVSQVAGGAAGFATVIQTAEGAGLGGSGVVRTVEELEDREKVFPALSKKDVEYEGYSVDSIPSDEYSLEEICDKFRKYLAKEEKLYFDIETIRFFISGLGTTHFSILEGLSGTGKSSLPRYFAKFINAESLFIPVQATWRDRTNLLGFFNEFSKTYSETEFLISLYEANYNPDKLYIYVLDEMNISRVEYYFADFLSVLEYPAEDWKLKVMQLPYNFLPPAKLFEGVIQIPENVYFVGTANKDDSTFTITNKVYDRAITIEFDDRNDPFEVKEEVSTITISKTHLDSLYLEAKEDLELQMNDEDFEKFTTITNFVNNQFDITFGNRILNQITTLVPIYVACGGKKEEALDFLLSRKIISQLEGRFEEYVKGALKELLVLIEKTYGANILKRSEKTIQSLIRRL